MSYRYAVQGPTTHVADLLLSKDPDIVPDPSQREAVEEHRRLAADMLRAWARLLDASELGEVNVVVSGHANPGHRSQHGWADDAMQVSVAAIRKSASP